jgi:predicted nucleic acid-binding protein
MAKVFLDTNFLVYAIDNRDVAKRNTARRLLRNLEPESSAVISTQVLQEFYVAATRKLGVAPSIARGVVRLLANFEVVTVTPPLVERAIDHSIAHQLSFWDALIMAAAEAGECDVAWTEDWQSGREVAGVRVVNPFLPA